MVTADVIDNNSAKGYITGEVIIETNERRFSHKLEGSVTHLSFAKRSRHLVVATTRGIFFIESNDYSSAKQVMNNGPVWEVSIDDSGNTVSFLLETPVPFELYEQCAILKVPIPSRWYELWIWNNKSLNKLQWYPFCSGHREGRLSEHLKYRASWPFTPLCIDQCSTGSAIAVAGFPAQGIVEAIHGQMKYHSLEWGATTSYVTCTIAPDQSTVALGTSAGSVYVFPFQSDDDKEFSFPRWKFYELYHFLID